MRGDGGRPKVDGQTVDRRFVKPRYNINQTRLALMVAKHRCGDGPLALAQRLLQF